jgi:NhaP-type Na+/H+ or K+/H+ antiporter
MSDLDPVLVVIGALVLGLGVVSGLVHTRLPLSTPLLALLTGVAIGPAGFDLLDPGTWGPREAVLGAVARLTLAIGLMATALRLPPRYFFDHWRLQALLIGVLMPLMWIVAALLVYAWLGVPVLLALLIAAVVTPTDPIVASGIVTAGIAKKLLPERVRHTLSAESGANDGLATAFVAVPILLLTRATEAAATAWLTEVLVREVLGGILLGLLVGAAAGRLLTWSERKNYLEESSFLAFSVALALLVLGAAGLAGTNGVLAVFVAGVAFDNGVGGRERAEEAEVQEAVNQFFTLPVFALLGLMVPVREWLALGWPAAGLVLTILAFRRLPGMLAIRAWLAPVDDRRDALFLGWFGPIGVSALLYATEAVHRTGQEAVWPVVSLIVCGSILAHGATATPLTRMYGRLAKRP